MTAYMMIKNKIIKVSKRNVDFEELQWYSGYITGIRDVGMLTNKQVAILDKQLRGVYYN